MEITADYHVHVGFGNFRQQNRSGKFLGTDLDNGYNNLLEYRDKGITLLRDGGDRNMVGLRLRSAGKELGITLKSPGRALVRRGCYGKYLGEPVANLEDLKRELDFLLKQEVDHFKVVQSGIVAVNGDAQKDQGFFDDAMLALIMDCAGENSLPVMVHVNFPQAIKTAVDAGVTTIEHGYFITEPILGEMAAKAIAWTPTLAPFANALTYDTWIPGWRREIVEKVVEEHSKMIKTAAGLGVQLLAGSDGGTSICPHGRCTIDEHRLLKDLVGDGFKG